MPPKAKQAARRANAKAAAKGAGKGHVPLDEAAERANFERLCPLQRGRIQELAARMAGSLDTTPDQMLPAAMRASRELPELLTNAARAGAATPVTVSRGGRIIYHGSDPEAMEAALQPGDLVSRPSGECIEFLGREDPAPWESTIAFALDRRGLQQPVANGMVMEWLVAMFPGPDPPEYKWYRIPAELLHSDLEVVYVNFAAFMEAHSHIFRGPREQAARADDRPLITAQWRDQHPDEWQRLWHQCPTECPVCHEKPDIWDGPMNSDVPTRCTHWICVGCWAEISQRDRRCPICRDDLTVWLRRFADDE